MSLLTAIKILALPGGVSLKNEIKLQTVLTNKSTWFKNFIEFRNARTQFLKKPSVWIKTW